MKLWIRSADREHFTEAHGIDYNMDCIVDSMTEEEKYCHKIVDDRGKVLGIYETKERCFEIIDEIQNILCRSEMILFKDIDITNLSPKDIEPFKAISWCSSPIANEKSEVTVHNMSVVVYEMPEE